MTADPDIVAAYAAHGFNVGDTPPRRDLGDGFIDLTPTYCGVLPALLAALTNGTPEGQRMARKELHRMAQIADLHNLIASRLSDAPT